MRAGARNRWKGVVVEVKEDGMMCKVRVKLADGIFVSSVMTKESLDELGIKEGDEVTVLIKAVNVLLIKE